MSNPPVGSTGTRELILTCMVRSRVPSKILGVIPARYASSRFPGKALARLDSRTMLEHVYERVSMARYLSSVVIATDDERIRDEARRFGARVQMTRADHLSGTDRVAEVASAFAEAELVVNIQGDEPLIDPGAIDAALLPLLDDPANSHGNAEETHRRSPRDFRSECGESCDRSLRQRDLFFALGDSLYTRRRHYPHFKHTGLYVYRREFLMGYSELPVGPLEKAEKLEQLAPWKTDSPSAWWKRITSRWAWIRRRIWSVFRRCCGRASRPSKSPGSGMPKTPARAINSFS